MHSLVSVANCTFVCYLMSVVFHFCVPFNERYISNFLYSSPEYFAGQASLIRQFTNRLSSYTIPCYIATGPATVDPSSPPKYWLIFNPCFSAQFQTFLLLCLSVKLNATLISSIVLIFNEVCCNFVILDC